MRHMSLLLGIHRIAYTTTCCQRMNLVGMLLKLTLIPHLYIENDAMLINITVMTLKSHALSLS